MLDSKFFFEIWWSKFASIFRGASESAFAFTAVSLRLKCTQAPITDRERSSASSLGRDLGGYLSGGEGLLVQWEFYMW